MKKAKILSMLLALIMLLSLVTGCGGKVEPKATEPAGTEAAPEPEKEAEEETEAPKEEAPAETEAEADTSAEGTFELALITDVGTIDDKSFNQGSWEGLEAYAKEHKLTYKYYQPTEQSDEAYIASIDLAVQNGAKVIVCPGFLFEIPIHEQQAKYPEVMFILIDGYPHAGDYTPDIAPNTHAIIYKEEQSGYLAGYAAVIDGYRQLGFMGGMAVPAVVRFGYGFVQGADEAAQELGLEKGDVTVKYTYVGGFEPSPEHQAKAASWYNEGTEVIFACGGGIGSSIMRAAEIAEKKVIGVDVDQSGESPTIITSAMKNLQKSVYDTIASIYDGTWVGGELVTLGVESENVLLPMTTSQFGTFDQEKYDEVYAKLVAGHEIARDDVGEDVLAVPVEIVTVELID